MGQERDLTGERFGRLRVIRRMQTARKKNASWYCLCDCGKSKRVRADLLSSGITQSCGCLARETARAKMTTHGLSKTPEYAVWASMIRRCHNENHVTYRNYGARGIRVCERWRKSFENFYADMGPRPSSKHTVERIDGGGPYSPNNCRWATYSEQNRNISTNRNIEIDGVSFCVADWCRLFEISPHRPYDMIYYNKRSGIKTVEEAINTLYRNWIANS